MKQIVPLILIINTLNFISCQEQKDYSKTLEEYYTLGFPNVENKWNTLEMETAINAIEKLKRIDEFALPKMNSEKSSVYFDKILQELPRVDLSNYKGINGEFQTFSRFEKLMSRLAFAYGPSEKLQIYYSNEAIEFNKLSVQEMTKVGKLYQILVSNLPDSMRQKNNENEKLFERGIVKVFEASLETHLPYNKYAPEDNIELARVISTNLPIAWPWLNHDSKSSIMQQLVGLSKESEISEIKEIYSALLKQLED